MDFTFDIAMTFHPPPPFLQVFIMVKLTTNQGDN